MVCCPISPWRFIFTWFFSSIHKKKETSFCFLFSLKHARSFTLKHIHTPYHLLEYTKFSFSFQNENGKKKERTKKYDGKKLITKRFEYDEKVWNKWKDYEWKFFSYFRTFLRFWAEWRTEVWMVASGNDRLARNWWENLIEVGGQR